MAWAFVASADYDSSSSTSGTPNKPTGTADNDIMFAFIKRVGSTDPSAVPSGWTLIAKQDITSGNSFWLYWKLAASEGASYQWDWAALARTGITIATFRDEFNTSNPIDVFSDTGYETSNTTVRAASMTTSAANEPVIFFGGANGGSSITFNPQPSSPTSLTEHLDVYSAASRFARTISSALWTGSGATGDMDATASATTADKHAFAVALNPATAATTKPWYYYAQIQ